MENNEPKATGPREWELEHDEKRKAWLIKIPPRTNDAGEFVGTTLFTQCEAEAKLIMRAKEADSAIEKIREAAAREIRRVEQIFGDNQTLAIEGMKKVRDERETKLRAVIAGLIDTIKLCKENEYYGIGREAMDSIEAAEQALRELEK